MLGFLVISKKKYKYTVKKKSLVQYNFKVGLIVGVINFFTQVTYL